MHGGHSDRCGPDFAVRCEKLVCGSKWTTVKFSGYHIGAGKSSINNADQANGSAILLKLVINASVIASKRSNADYRDWNEFFVSQKSFSGQPEAAQIGRETKNNGLPGQTAMN
jgi:hypothetical protein